VIEVKVWGKLSALDKLTKILGGYDKGNRQKNDIYVFADNKPS